MDRTSAHSRHALGVCFRSLSPEETEAFAERLGRALEPGDLIALDGDLGAGKTLFVRGLARGLDVEESVSSPTYALQHEYEGRLTLHHFDAWMEGRERAFLEDGGAELLGTDGVAVVEWASRIRDALPEPFLQVTLSGDPEGPAARRVELWVEGRGERAEGLLERVRGALA